MAKIHTAKRAFRNMSPAQYNAMISRLQAKNAESQRQFEQQLQDARDRREFGTRNTEHLIEESAQ